MITVISGTNRKNSKCLIFAEQYVAFLKQHTEEAVELIALENLPSDWLTDTMYDSAQLSATITNLQDRYIFPAKKFMVVSSEYNGSFPGVLKLFIDTLSVRQYPKNFKGKKVAFAGVADGRAGNIRGMGHLTHIFNHVGAVTMPAQMPYSSAKNLVENDKITDEATLNLIEAHAEQLIQF